ncbi:hypothetical protein HDU96_002907 [Phlyctochytrium bullatum]|nr:hypothetical protein HDU96_002907 [Phlyctochytrium bullatum]
MSSTVKVKPPSDQVEYLNGLRAIACWFVFNVHCIPGIPKTQDGFDIFYLLRGHDIGVGMFYMLSGRVLAMAFLKTGKPAILASSTLRRPIRLGLPAMGASFLHWLFYHLNLYVYSPPATEKMGSFYLLLKDGAAGIDDLWHCFVRGIQLVLRGEVPQYPVGVQWTIGHEITGSFQIYLMALIMHFFPRRRILFCFAVFATLYTFRCLFAYFVAGLLMAELQPYIAALSVNAKRLTTFACVMFLAVWWLWVDFKDIIDHSHMVWSLDSKGNFGKWDETPPFWTLVPSKLWGAVAMLLWAEVSPEFQSFLEWEPISFLAKVSFGFYLMHPLAGAIFGAWAIVDLLPANTPEGKITALPAGYALLLYTITLLGTVVMAWGFYHTMDKLSIDAGKALQNFMAEPKPAGKEVRKKEKDEPLLAQEEGNARKD